MPLWDLKQAEKAANDELELMQGAKPPAAIAEDFAAWKTFVQKVEDAASRTGADASDLQPLLRQSKKLEPVSKRLTDWSFANCA